MTTGRLVEVLITLHGAGPEYVVALAAMYASMRTHTTAALRFWIVHDDTVGQSDLRTVAAFIGDRDTVRLVDVTGQPHIADIARECADPRYSPAALWRVYAPELCTADKVLLADADLVFLCDVEALWNTPLGAAPLSAVLRGKPWPLEYHAMIRTPPDRYFRIGLTVLNLAAIRLDARFLSEREEFLRSRLPAVNALVCLPEQSVFNYFFSAGMVPLDVNLCPAGHFDPTDPDRVEWMLNKMDCSSRIVLDLKGWQNRSPFDYFYWCYLLMTPWRRQAYEFLDRQLPGASPSA
jgi:lipopolysaccharide biosynthesis glycosyltransferase